MIILVEETFYKDGETKSTLTHICETSLALATFKEQRMEKLLSEGTVASVKFYEAHPIEVGHFKKEWNVAYEVEKVLDEIPF